MEKTKTFQDLGRRAVRNPGAIGWILRVHNSREKKTTEPRPLLGGTPQQAAKDLPRLKDIGIDHVFYDMNHPAHVPIDTQLVLLRRLVRLIKRPRNALVGSDLFLVPAAKSVWLVSLGFGKSIACDEEEAQDS